jgi:hypothetical protein
VGYQGFSELEGFEPETWYLFKIVRTQPTDWASVFFVRVGDRRPHAHVPSTSCFSPLFRLRRVKPSPGVGLILWLGSEPLGVKDWEEKERIRLLLSVEEMDWAGEFRKSL